MVLVAEKRLSPSSPLPEEGQTPLRVPDVRLLEALDVYAKRVKRSRNMAIVFLLEQAMTAEQLWPPPPADAKGE